MNNITAKTKEKSQRASILAKASENVLSLASEY